MSSVTRGRANGATPFFESPGGSQTKRRLLLISPRFAPAQDIGALRWQKMARFASERGWELDVITVDPNGIGSPNWSSLADLPSGTRVYGVPSPVVPLARVVHAVWTLLRRLLSGVRRPARRGLGPNLSNGANARPDSLPREAIRWSLREPRGWVRAYNAWEASAEEATWARHAAALARRIITPASHDAIISSGPPHAAHEAARLVSRTTGIPFIADMRDVWSLVQQCLEPFASPLLLHIARRRERRVVREAALVAANTDVVRAAMIGAYPDASDRILTVMNGYDDDPIPASQHGSQFVVAHAGTIYVDRDPTCLFRAARALVGELRLTPEQFALKFMGANDRNVSLSDMAHAEGIAQFVQDEGARPRAMALEFLSRATVLVILPQNWDMSIPAKLFEYMRFDAWLLVLAEPRSATALLLRDTDADVVSPRDVGEIAAVLRRRYEQYAAGVRPRRLATNDRLSRRHQAQVLLDAVDRCVSSRRAR